MIISLLTPYDSSILMQRVVARSHVALLVKVVNDWTIPYQNP